MTSRRSYERSSPSRSGLLVLSGDADGNLGDRAILLATCLGARAVRPDVAISVVSSDRDGSLRALGIDAIPRGPRGFLRLCATALRRELALCGGGGLFQDDDSLIKMPYWGARVALIRLLCPRIVGYSLGVGPLRAWSSRLFARLAFACMERVSARDENARATAQALTRKPVALIPDPALLLPPASDEQARTWLLEHGVPNDGSPLVGVAIRRWFPPSPRLLPNTLTSKLGGNRSFESPESQRMTELLAHTLDDAVRRHGAYIVFLPTYNVSHEGDDKLCEETLAKMSTPRGRVLRIGDPSLYKGVAAQLAVLLGGRMHPTIFAASVGTPIVGLSYNPKFAGFFQLMGVPNQVMDVQDFVNGRRADDLARMVDRAMSEKRPLRETMDRLTGEIRAFNRMIFAGQAS